MRSQSKVELYPTVNGHIGLKQYNTSPLSPTQSKIIAYALLRGTTYNDFIIRNNRHSLDRELFSQEIRKVFPILDLNAIEKIGDLIVTMSEGILEDRYDDEDWDDNLCSLEFQTKNIFEQCKLNKIYQFEDVLMFVRIFCRFIDEKWLSPYAPKYP